MIISNKSLKKQLDKPAEHTAERRCGFYLFFFTAVILKIGMSTAIKALKWGETLILSLVDVTAIPTGSPRRLRGAGTAPQIEVG